MRSVSSSKIVHKALSLMLFIALLISVELALVSDARTNNIPANARGRRGDRGFKGYKISAPCHSSPSAPKGCKPPGH
ncbi:hypothetical protein I3843_01G101600 [Carya illinoinensis]|nr:hypothetical protein I3843_01G101600 [Carya illinoinensis]